MTSALFFALSDAHAQGLVGGAGSQPTFVQTWHGGIGTPDHQPEGGANNAGIVADSGGLNDGGANNLHGFAGATAGGSGVNPVG